MLCLLFYESLKKLNQFSPYKIQFDLHLSLNPDVPDLLMDGLIVLFVSSVEDAVIFKYYDL